mmetsp:Transcript_10655/g.14921  ORF Transcript_10655/g.14921 Transcript_10655/m.14921 type:complete len:362 (-) Transcript_10655:355-1440(-)
MSTDSKVLVKCAKINGLAHKIPNQVRSIGKIRPVTPQKEETDHSWSNELGYMPRPNEKFATKTYALIETCHEHDPDVASWTEEQNGFVIKDKTKFVKQYYPKVFGKNTKYESFVRQLNTYQFRKEKTNFDQGNPDDTDVYTHKGGNFCRGDPSRLHNIKAKRPRTGSDAVAARKEMVGKNGATTLENIESQISELRQVEMAEQKKTVEKIFFGMSHISNRLEVFFKLLKSKMDGDTVDCRPTKRQKCSDPREVATSGDFSSSKTSVTQKGEDVLPSGMQSVQKVESSISSENDEPLPLSDISIGSMDSEMDSEIAQLFSTNQVDVELGKINERLDQMEQNQVAMNNKIDFLIKIFTSKTNK